MSEQMKIQLPILSNGFYSMDEVADAIVGCIDDIEREGMSGLAEQVRRRLNARGTWPPSVPHTPSAESQCACPGPHRQRCPLYLDSAL